MAPQSPGGRATWRAVQGQGRGAWGVGIAGAGGQGVPPGRARWGARPPAAPASSEPSTAPAAAGGRGAGRGAAYIRRGAGAALLSPAAAARVGETGRAIERDLTVSLRGWGALGPGRDRGEQARCCNCSSSSNRRVFCYGAPRALRATPWLGLQSCGFGKEEGATPLHPHPLIWLLGLPGCLECHVERRPIWGRGEPRPSVSVLVPARQGCAQKDGRQAGHGRNRQLR